MNDNRDATAGWGVTISVPGRRFLLDLFGPVLCDALQPTYLFANTLSNNTAEVSALAIALAWIISRAPLLVEVQSDSTYAQKVTLGEWRPCKNIRLIVFTRRLYKMARSTTNIRFTHVYGHSGDRMNHRADRLAAMGAHSITLSASLPSARVAVADGISRGLADIDPYAGFRAPTT